MALMATTVTMPWEILDRMEQAPVLAERLQAILNAPEG